MPSSDEWMVSQTMQTITHALSKVTDRTLQTAIETLAAVTDVCSDKTGTITLGKMVMQRAWVPAIMSSPNSEAEVKADTAVGQLYTIETGSDPYYPRGRVLAIGPDEKGDAFGDDEDSDDPDRTDDLVDKNNMEKPLRNLTLCASLCSSATLQRVHHDEDDPTKGKWEGHGDATEVALQVVSLLMFHLYELHINILTLSSKLSSSTPSKLVTVVLISLTSQIFAR